MTSVDAASGAAGEVARYARSWSQIAFEEGIKHIQSRFVKYCKCRVPTFCGARNASNLLTFSSNDTSLPRVEYLSKGSRH